MIKKISETVFDKLSVVSKVKGGRVEIGSNLRQPALIYDILPIVPKT